MSGFICPKCSHESQIFKPVSGGAEAMCDELGYELLGKIPLDPDVLMATEGGKCFYREKPESLTSTAFKNIVDKIVDKCNSEVKEDAEMS
mmetsp:Transcript_10672/g.10544  ORF Transcript_10672/g.10544 Transcript_10672/m.10544 type:complete len:90 (+) Transcript_10672:735-1004(+)